MHAVDDGHLLAQRVHRAAHRDRLLRTGRHQHVLGAGIQHPAQLQRHVGRLRLDVDHFHQVHDLRIGLGIGRHAAAHVGEAGRGLGGEHRHLDRARAAGLRASEYHSMKPTSSCTKVGRVDSTHWLGRQPKPLAADASSITTLSVGRRCCSAAVSGPPSRQADQRLGRQHAGPQAGRLRRVVARVVGLHVDLDLELGADLGVPPVDGRLAPAGQRRHDARERP